MVRDLQNIIGVNIDAQKKAGANMKRGTFVSVDEANGTLSPATATADVAGIVVRDTVVDDDVANGMPINEYGDTQDLIKQGEYCGLRALHNGERTATTEFDSALTNETAKAGKYLAVAGGKLAESASNAKTKIVSVGFIMEGSKKLLGYKIVN